MGVLDVGYYALAETIHKVTGQAWNEYLNDWIFKPSGMTATLLYTDAVLTESERRQMTTPVRLSDGSSAAYGFGWHVDVVGGQRRVWHGGGLPGFSAQFVRFPDAGVTIILLANGDDVDTASIANGLVALHYLPRRATAQ